VVEAIIKKKLSSSYPCVRKAFLALDTNFDGYVEVEDIMRHFGDDSALNFDDLKKLVMDKDSKKKGRINYQDFSRWLGSAIS